MAEASAPADNRDFNSAQWRGIFASRFADGILDPKSNTALGYPLPSSLPASGNTLTIGPGSSSVAGFRHEVTGTQDVTIPAPSGGTTVYTVAIRYDPARTIPNPDYDSADPDSPATLGVPCALVVLAGSPGGAAPTPTSLAAGNTTQDFRLYSFTRTVGGSIAVAGRTDHRLWVGGSGGSFGTIAPDPGINGVPPTTPMPKPGRGVFTTGTAGRVTVIFSAPFPGNIHALSDPAVESAAGDAYATIVGTPTKAGFVASIRSANGAPFVLGRSVTLNYVAWGW